MKNGFMQWCKPRHQQIQLGEKTSYFKALVHTPERENNCHSLVLLCLGSDILCQHSLRLCKLIWSYIKDGCLDMNLETFVCVCARADGFLSLKVSDKKQQPQIQILYLTVLYDLILWYSQIIFVTQSIMSLFKGRTLSFVPLFLLYHCSYYITALLLSILTISFGIH